MTGRTNARQLAVAGLSVAALAGAGPAAAGAHFSRAGTAHVASAKSTGRRGPRGKRGPRGYRGASGAQGATGPQGATGAQGAAGPQGAAGAQGATGAQGAAGAQGAVGAQGAAGAQGAQGAQGPRGVAGSKDPAYVTYNSYIVLNSSDGGGSGSAVVNVFTPATAGNYLVNTADTIYQAGSGQVGCYIAGTSGRTEPMFTAQTAHRSADVANTGIVYAKASRPVIDVCAYNMGSPDISTIDRYTTIDAIPVGTVNGSAVARDTLPRQGFSLRQAFRDRGHAPTPKPGARRGR